MLTKILLTKADLEGMLSAVLAYNRRGELVGVSFHAEDQSLLPVAYAEVYVEETGLAVRALPESDSPSDIVNPPVADPRKVPAPASLVELQRLTDGP